MKWKEASDQVDAYTSAFDYAREQMEQYNVANISNLESIIFELMKRKNAILILQKRRDSMYSSLSWDVPARLLDPQKYYYVDDMWEIQRISKDKAVATSEWYEKFE